MLFAVILAPVGAQEPVHVQVDKVMDASRLSPAAPAADDATFLRRASVVFTGMPPTSDEARAFCKDTTPDKRASLVARLAGGAAFVRHLAVQLDVMLMERRAEKHTKAAEWRQWLEDSLAAGKPWDQLIRELLAADGSDEKKRPAARWLLERQCEPNLLTRDTGRLFLGRDMGCAQCHDHPRIDDYAQRDYHGLYSFFSRTSLFQPDANKPGFVAELATGDSAFTSVFTKVSGAARPHLPEGAEIEEPVIPAAEQWVVAPNDKDKNVRPVPKYSRRARLADSMVQSRAFRRNIANRLWGMVMGRCLVEPPDVMHSGNAPALPALLDTLGEGIAAMKFDLRGFMRELALTKIFAEAFDPAPLPAESQESLAKRLPALEADAAKLKAEASRLSVAFTEQTEALEELQRKSEPVIAEWTKAETASAEAKKAHAAAIDAANKAATAKISRAESLRVLNEAANAAAAACRTAPADKDLAAALKTFQDKSAAVQTSLGTADKEIAAKQLEAKAKETAAAAALQAAESKKAPADEAKKKVVAAMQAVTEANAKKQSARIIANETAWQVKEAQAMVAYMSAMAAAAPLLAIADRAEAACAAAKNAMAAHSKVISEAKAALPAMEKAAADAASQLVAAKTAAAAAQAHLNAMRDAAGKAVIAAHNLPADKDIEGASKTLQSRAEDAVKDADAKTKAVSEAETAAAQIAMRPGQLKEVMARAETARTAAEQKLAALKPAAADAAAKASVVRAALNDARQALAAAQTGTFSVAGLASLTPEQFCWSVLKVTGALDQMQEQAAKEWDAKNKPTDADKADPAKQTARAAAIDKLTRGKVKPNEDQFVRLFGNSAGQPQSDFFATADQALYFENAGALRSWTQPSGNNLAARLVKLTAPETIAEELYLSTLTRLPDAGEAADLTQLIAARPPDQKGAVVSDVMWAMLTSLEFRFRH